MRCAVLLLALLPAVSTGAAQPPPDALAEPVREALAPAVTAADHGWTVWPVREPPLADAPAGGLGVAFPDLVPGGLLGAVEIAAPWTDYRGRGVEPGVYTLRYGVLPEDGYHLGVSLYRDFAYLLPAADDRTPAPRDEADAIEASRAAAGGGHPAVAALWPVEEGAAAGEVVGNDLGQPTLVVAVGGVVVGVVVEGSGEGS